MGNRYLPEHGLCIVELVKTTRLGNKDFQRFGCLTTHDEQLPFQGLGPQCPIVGVCNVLDQIELDGTITNKQMIHFSVMPQNLYCPR